MQQVPVYVVTGFLGEGKTTFLNGLLNHPSVRKIKTLLIQFENGEESFYDNNSNFKIININKKDLEQREDSIAGEIYEKIEDYKPNQVWIEWNGVTKFSKLLEIFLYPLLHKICSIKKVIHVASERTLTELMGRTGEALPEQISNCDIAVVRGDDFNRNKKIIHSINSDAKVFKIEEFKKIYEMIFKENKQVIYFLFGILSFSLAYFILMPLFTKYNIPVNLVITMFLGTLLQAIPFLLIGVLISSLIQIFITKEAIEKRFPKKLGPGMLFAILFGFCLPVCDCAAIPIFKSLIKKGVPVAVAVTFMTASPVINPVVILSTYNAFNGELSIVLSRLALGLIASILIGILFYIFPSKEKPLASNVDGAMCNCGCYDGGEGANTLKEKLSLFLRHSQMEFFNVGKYLVIGAFASSIFQVVIKKSYFDNGNMGSVVSTLIMMALAFLFSLCSSSDAIIAKSFGTIFSATSLMGFLVFGPMIDIKNVILLSSSFSNKFIGKLALITFLVCFSCVFIFGNIFLGG